MSNDTISRQAAKEAYCKHFCHRGAACPDTLCKEVNEAFDELPSAQPKRKIGHWLLNGERYGVQYYRCSECEEEEEGFNCAYMNYCPNCGARMEGGMKWTFGTGLQL